MVLALTSHFMLVDVDTLDKQKPNEQMFQFFSWWSELNKIKDGKISKIPSFSVDYVYYYYKTENKTIQGKYE